MPKTLSELTDQLRRDPWRCPNCQGQNIARLDKGAMIVGSRQCKNCGCYWEPPWAKFTIRTGLVIMSIMAATACYYTWVQLPGILNGEGFKKALDAGVLRGFFEHIGGPIMLVIAFGGLHQCIAALRGKKGQGKVLAPGRDIEQ